MKQVIELYRQAFVAMEAAAFQSHSGHWDSQGTYGLHCPECIRANKLRKEAVELMERAESLYAKCLSTTHETNLQMGQKANGASAEKVLENEDAR